MRWAVQYAHSLLLKYTENRRLPRLLSPPPPPPSTLCSWCCCAVYNIMRASGDSGGGGVRGRQPLITQAHTLRSPILIIIMTELQLACRAAGTLLSMRLCFYWCAAVEKITAPNHLSQRKSMAEIVRVGGSWNVTPNPVFRQTDNLMIYSIKNWKGCLSTPTLI